MNTYNVGETDEWGFTLRRLRGPVELWETPNGNYAVYLYAANEDTLHASRKYREDADELFNGVCNMFPDLEPEKG